MGINYYEGRSVQCTLADGSVTSAWSIRLDELRIGRVRVRNVHALVLDSTHSLDSDGLLGMSFLNNFLFQIDTEKDQLILRQKQDRS